MTDRLARRSLLAATGAAVLLALTGCPGQPADEGEDCDAEDYANREAECGFTKRKKKPAKTTKTKSRSKK